jgi:carbamoyltransferase
LKLFAENTGVPILVNTSFNVRGEPIVESPEDAIKCFLSTDLDALVIGSFIVEKNLQDKKTLESSNVFRKDWPND